MKDKEQDKNVIKQAMDEKKAAEKKAAEKKAAEKKAEEKKNRRPFAKFMCSLCCIQGVLAWVAVIAYFVFLIVGRDMDHSLFFWKIFVAGILFAIVRVEKYLSLVAWLVARGFRNRQIKAGSESLSAKMAVWLNRSYLFTAGIGTIVYQIVIYLINRQTSRIKDGNVSKKSKICSEITIVFLVLGKAFEYTLFGNPWLYADYM